MVLRHSGGRLHSGFSLSLDDHEKGWSRSAGTSRMRSAMRGKAALSGSLKQDARLLGLDDIHDAARRELGGDGRALAQFRLEVE